MDINQDLAEKMNHLMEYYQARGDDKKAAAFSVASTKLRGLEEPVTTMSPKQLHEEHNLDEAAVKKIREYVETGNISEFEG